MRHNTFSFSRRVGYSSLSCMYFVVNKDFNTCKHLASMDRCHAQHCRTHKLYHNLRWGPFCMCFYWVYVINLCYKRWLIFEVETVGEQPKPIGLTFSWMGKEYMKYGFSINTRCKVLAHIDVYEKTNVITLRPSIITYHDSGVKEYFIC